MARSLTDDGYTTSHRFKWGPLPPNDIVRIARHVREGVRSVGTKGRSGWGTGKGTYVVKVKFMRRAWCIAHLPYRVMKYYKTIIVIN